jgi:hypothetical protein
MRPLVHTERYKPARNSYELLPSCARGRLTREQDREINVAARVIGDLYEKDFARQLMARAQKGAERDPLDAIPPIVTARMQEVLAGAVAADLRSGLPLAP